MKKLILCLLCSLYAIYASAQAPQRINYQAVARDNTGALLASKTVSVQLSIIRDSALGATVYTETFSPATNAFGLFTVQIGGGKTVSGSFTTINWGAASYFLKVEMDASGGTSYVLMGTQQLISVPYALYAEKSGDAHSYKPGNGISINNDSISNTAQDRTVTLAGTGGSTVAGSYPTFTINSKLYKAGNGVKISNDSIINTSTDKTVNLTGSGSTAVSGTYPNFTISSSDSTMWKRSGSSNIYYKGGNVGIGTTTPAFILDVKGETNADSFALASATIIKRKGQNNLSIGKNAGRITSGYENLFIGDSTGFNNTSGNQNTAMGYKSLYSNTNGWFNVANGYHTLYSNTGGYNNVANGWNSMTSNTTGWTNTASGLSSLTTNTTGNNNTAIGGYAMVFSTTGNFNTAIGVNTLHDNASGSYNTANGFEALYSSKGDRNTAVGRASLFSNTSGSYNVALGNKAGYTNTTGSNNTFLGDSADATTSGLTNATAIGYGARVSQSNSLVLGNNVKVGVGTSIPKAFLEVLKDTTDLLKLTSSTSGTGNKAYLDFLTYSGTGVNARIGAIDMGSYNGGLLFEVGNTSTSNTTATKEAMRIDNNGNVGIGTSTPQGKLHVMGNDPSNITVFALSQPSSSKYGPQINLDNSANAGGRVWIIGSAGSSNQANNGSFQVHQYGVGTRMVIDTLGNMGIGTKSPSERLSVSGNICYTGSIGSCSDRRYKTNIISMSGMLSKVMELNPVYYNWKIREFPDKNFSDRRQIGFIAQDIEKLFPELVLTDDKGYKSVDYSKVTPILVQAVKEQQKEIEELKAQNALILQKLNMVDSKPISGPTTAERK